MTKPSQLTRLIEQEKLLYLEVEQLRYSLYLHDESILFQFISAFYFAYTDFICLFSRKRVKDFSPVQEKKLSITILLRRRNNYLVLQRTPYAWIIYLARYVSRSLSFRARPSRVEKSLIKGLPSKKSIVIYGSTEGSDLQSRSVQIARTLAKSHDVFYIEGIFDEGIRSGYRIIEDSGRFKSVRLTVYKSFHLNYQKPSPEEIKLLKRSLRLVTVSTLFPPTNKTYVHHPFWDSVIPFKKKSFSFDRGCNFAHHHNAAQHIIDADKKLMNYALSISAPSPKLLRNKKDTLVRNGVDWNHFRDTSKMIQTCDVGLCWIKKPVMGFIGTLDEQVDEVLVGSIATAFPTASIVLVGNTDYRPVIEVAEKYQNIFPVGKQQYKKLPLFLQSFDILISPLKYNKSVPTIHPELALYLSSGKPIVAAPLATAAVAKGLMYQAKTHTEWMIAIAEALKEKPRSKKKYLRIAMAKKMKWKSPRLG